MPNLTGFSKKNNGVFPFKRVMKPLTAHRTWRRMGRS